MHFGANGLHAVLVQVLPYWTKSSLLNLAAVVCWRHAASLKPASIHVTSTPATADDPDAEQEVAAALACLHLPEKVVPLEV